MLASIKLENLSIDIPIYDVAAASVRTAVLRKAIGGRFAEAGSHVTVSALRDLSFAARDGDRIALVGNNGSGKSTLLRVLSDVYPPTRGKAEVIGRVSPLFDATLGMNMDATGWENVHLSGRIWGLTAAEIAASKPDIAEFTELGTYLDVPVRTYSNGMMLRLAFAIATARVPEIFLIDEVIGVGDVKFFNKAFTRLRQVVERASILFVASHADAILKQLCDKAIWLDSGALMAFGPIDEVLEAYRAQGAMPPSGEAPVVEA
jgi:ABC-2 type transport system ATP-binding protein/lipopolysaccharide transport system ATP-binding protein